ncbi:MAG: hypothetical protein NTW87_18970 [Planctomycetota bacterium]|nr:hypothetical protein [Planctomycetota bacterium]
MDEEALFIELSACADGELDADKARSLEQRLAHQPELRRMPALYRKLDEEAARLPVPLVSVAAARRAWRSVAERTTEVSPADRRAFARLDQAAAALPVPTVSDLIYEQVWEAVVERVGRGSSQEAGRTQSAILGSPVPAVSEERWQAVWQGILHKTHAAQREPRALSSSRAEARSQEPGAKSQSRAHRRWRWLAAASLAAAALFAALVFVPQRQEEQPVAMEVPQALDSRYHVQVEYLPGQQAPVVCFLLKDDTGRKDDTQQNWRWLPDLD